MGIKYSSSESSSLIEAMNSNIEIANEITDRLSSGSDHLISVLESGKLQGAAYTAGKNLFSEIIIPSIKKALIYSILFSPLKFNYTINYIKINKNNNI